MRSSLWKHWYLTAAAVLLFVSASFAQQPVTMTLSTVNGAYAGTNPTVYTNPYTGTINGVSSTIICDDYADETYFGEQWTAYAYNETSAGSSNVKWDPVTGLTQQQIYNEISWLATQLLAAAPGQAQEDYSFAIWELACSASSGVNNSGGSPIGGYPCSPDPKGTLSSVDQGIVAQDIQNAGAHENVEFSNVTIYTPKPGSGLCGATNSTPCGTPQEFIVVTPESSTIVMLGADLLGLLALAFFFRRRALQTLN